MVNGIWPHCRPPRAPLSRKYNQMQNGADKPADSGPFVEYDMHLPPIMADEGDDGALPQSMLAKFLEARTILIFGGIDQKLAERVSAQMLYLDHLSDAPIKIILNSPGGHVESGDTIHDLISYVRSPVAVIGTGWVASAGTHIFLGAAKERRFCLPNTRFLIHQPSGGAGGRASDIEIQAHEIVKMRERLAQVISKALDEQRPVPGRRK